MTEELKGNLSFSGFRSQVKCRVRTEHYTKPLQYMQETFLYPFTALYETLFSCKPVIQLQLFKPVIQLQTNYSINCKPVIKGKDSDLLSLTNHPLQVSRIINVKKERLNLRKSRP